MDTKISGEQIKKANKPQAPKQQQNKAYVDKAVMPSKIFLAIVAMTLVLIISFSAAFGVVLLVGGDSSVSDNTPSGNNSTPGGNGGNKNPSSVIGGGTSVGGNSLGKTNPKRQSYISTRSSSVASISDACDVDNVILVDLDSYQSVAEKKADTRIYPASMTKVMSLLVACENLKSLKTKLKVSKAALDYAYRMEGSLFGVQQGDTLTTQDLLYLTSYYSDTVAVIMLAEHIAGSEAGFVQLMNKKAQSLGLSNTNFDNCTGLHSDNNYTTCREMAAIMAYALENPLCAELLTNTNLYKFSTDSGSYTLWSPSWYRDRLSAQPKLSTVTVKGGKTGYIDESGYCLVSYAIGTNSGRKYIQVVVGDTKKSDNVKYVYNNFAD